MVLDGCLDNQTDGLTALRLRYSVMFKLTTGHKPNTETLETLEGSVAAGTWTTHDASRRQRRLHCQTLRRLKMCIKKQFCSSLPLQFST